MMTRIAEFRKSKPGRRHGGARVSSILACGCVGAVAVAKSPAFLQQPKTERHDPRAVSSSTAQRAPGMSRPAVERGSLSPVVTAQTKDKATSDWLSHALTLGTSAAVGGSVATARKRQQKSESSSAQQGFLPDLQRDEDLAKWMPRLTLLAMAMFCSTNFTILKILGDGRSEAAVAATRFSVALLPFIALIPKYMDRLSIRSGVEIGLWCALGYITQAMGLQTTEASRGAFLCSLAMIVVPIAKAFMGAEVRAQIWVAAVTAVTGTGMLIGIGGGDAGAPGPNGGDVLCAITAIGFGLMFVRMDSWASQPGFSAMGCTAWQVVTLAVCMCLWVLATSGLEGATHEVASILSGGPETWGILAWLGFVTTALVLYVETAVMDEVDGAEAGIIFASEPVWATLFASVVLGEAFGPKEQMGAFLILCACLLTQLKFEDKDEKKEAVQQAVPLPTSR